MSVQLTSDQLHVGREINGDLDLALAGIGLRGLERGLTGGTVAVAGEVHVAFHLGVRVALDLEGGLNLAALGHLGDGAIGNGILRVLANVDVAFQQRPAALVDNIALDLFVVDDLGILRVGVQELEGPTRAAVTLGAHQDDTLGGAAGTGAGTSAATLVVLGAGEGQKGRDG